MAARIPNNSPEGIKKKTRNNYFTQNVQKFGENFFNGKDPARIEKDTKKIFQDLANGRISIPEQGHLFLNDKFLLCALDLATRTLQTLEFINDSVARRIMQDAAMGISCGTLGNDTNTKVRFALEAYRIIYGTLNQLYYTRDTSCLYPAANALSKYRDFI